MPERRNLARAVAVVLMMSFAAACAGGPQQESTGQYVDDAAITTKVKAKILQDPNLKVTQINVETYKGVVQLSGFVNSTDAAERAVQVAGNVEGVQKVENKMSIRR